MSNAAMFEATFPDKIDDWDKYADKSNPFDLSEDGQKDYTGALPRPIKVERAAARIDFRDGSRSIDDNSKPNDNTYPMIIVANEENQYNAFDVKLTRMALVNMSKNFYYLRRVSDDGSATDVKYLKPETSTNYVVDTDADAKGKNVSEKEDGITPGNADDYFNFPLFKNEQKDGYYQYNKEAWYADNIAEVLDEDKSINDTWDGSNTYKIWRYVTENTIPGIPQQKNVQSVGVVFKGSIRAGKHIEDAKYPKVTTNGKSDEEVDAQSEESTETPEIDDEREHYVSKAVRDALAEAAKNKDERDIENMPTLYSFENLLYASVDEMVNAAITKEGQGSTLYGALQVVLSNWILDAQSKSFNFDPDAAKHLAENTGTSIKYVALTPEICNDILNKTDLAEEGKYNKEYQIDFATGDKTNDAEKIQKFMTTAPKSNITVYEPSDEKDGEGLGYYCYYFYWNRHNDNLKSGRMGNMEFATVRNNVYKLAVTKINKFGHPGIPGHDPDPSEPEDPDEEELDYIQVRVEVLPWVVRVNDIEF
ncbi:MAG: Mfa1 fimbrilin C-terminal domain-containing protein [Prevotellaceae bacterium]|nr:Mfa1 fimbrilin C-terminal domain-containing protein [Prevotellaceae bacterium]